MSEVDYFDDYGDPQNNEYGLNEADINALDDNSIDSDDFDYSDQVDHYYYDDLGVYKCLISLNKQKADVLWNNIVYSRCLDFSTSKPMFLTEKASLVIKAFTYFLRKHADLARTRCLYYTIGLLEWLILPNVTGTKKSLRNLRKEARELYILLLENHFCDFIFSAYPKNHVLSNELLSSFEAVSISKNTDDADEGVIVSDVCKDFSKIVEEKSTTYFSKGSKYYPFVGQFNYQNQKYCIPGTDEFLYMEDDEVGSDEDAGE